MKGVEEERDIAKEETYVVQLGTIAASDSKASTEDYLTRAQGVLAATEEAKRKANTETTRLEVEWTSLLLEIKAAKDEVFSL